MEIEGELVVAKWAWVAAGEGQLTVEAATKLRLLDKSDGNWWLCQNGAGQGFVPSNYLQQQDPDLELYEEYLEMIDSGELSDHDVRDICTEEALFFSDACTGDKLLISVRNFLLQSLGRPTFLQQSQQPNNDISMKSVQEYIEIGMSALEKS